MTRLLTKIVSIGITNNTPVENKRKISIVNRLTLLFSFVGLLFVPIFHLFGYNEACSFLFLFVFLFSIVLLLNSLQKYSLAKVFFITISFASIYFFRAILGPNFYVELILLSGISVPFVLTSKSENYLHMLGLILGLSGFLLFSFTSLSNSFALQPANEDLKYPILLTAFLIPSLVLGQFKKDQANYEGRIKARSDTIQKKNWELKESNLLIISSNAELKEVIHEREVLMKEIHHRVKNNLQIITSLLGLQVNLIEGDDVKESFKSLQNRVNTMALAHELLYHSDNVATIKFAPFTSQLINRMLRILHNESNKTEVEQNIPDLNLNMNTAIPYGLLINEIISNALKHSQCSAEEKIYVKIESKEEDQYTLHIGDHGKGFPNEINFESSNSLGLLMIHNLVKQLKGSIEMTPEKGTHYIIRFKQA